MKIERLTEKFNDFYISKAACTDDLTLKLGKYEDIEELCEKIVSQPIYEKFKDTGEIHKEDYTEYYALYNFKMTRIEIYGLGFINYFDLEEYGKTRSLDKQTLEK